MTAPIVIRHGVLETTFELDGADLRPVRVVEDFGPRGGRTEYGPEWASDEALREAEAKVAAVDEPRRRKARLK